MVEIKSERNYFVVYLNGEFYCTEDTYKEARETAERLYEMSKISDR